jgi:membrane-bound lytic murein transglycosylase B
MDPQLIARRGALAWLLAASLPAGAGARPAVGPSYGRQAAPTAFAADVAARRGLSRTWIASQLARARRVDAVRRLIMPAPAASAKNWAAYRDRFIEARRIAAGLAFWDAHDGWLQEAHSRFGVAPEIVLGVLGVETFYGRITGGFRVIDALATLSFDFPPGRSDRSAFFRAELEEFFALCSREGSDPQSVLGSYAGAMGLPQFMPGSVNRYAVDFDGDGHVDVLRSAADAVGSVASYLAAFGWQRDMATHFAVTAPDDSLARAELAGPDIVPSFTPAQFADRGAWLDEQGRNHSGLLALVALQNGDAAPSHIAGTANFYVLTRYNASSYYALAVSELAQALRRERPG